MFSTILFLFLMLGTVLTGVNPALLKPQTFHVLTYLLGSRAIVPLPQRMCMIGIQSSTATAVAGVVVEVSDPSQIDGLFGAGSYMALMCRKAFETAAQLGAGPAFFAIPLAETTTKAVQTLTFGGTATIDGDLVIRIAGRYIHVGIANGTTANNASIAALAAINKYAQILPVVATNAAPVISLTDICKSTLGNDVLFDVVSVPAGLTAAFASSVVGAGVLDMQTALDALAGQQFDAIAVCNHLSADITEINAHNATAWGSATKAYRWFFMGEAGSIATATTLASAANHEGVEIINWQQSRSLPCEIAVAAAVGALSKDRPNANYDGMRLPLYPPPIAYSYTNAQIESALNAGVTPLVPVLTAQGVVVEGTGSVVRLITSRTTLNSVAFTITRDFGISRTAAAMARQYDIAFAAKFSALAATTGGVLLDDDTIQLVRDTVLGIDYAAQDSKWIRNVDDNKSRLVVEVDPSVSGRLNVDSTYTIVVGLHQVAVVHRAQIG